MNGDTWDNEGGFIPRDEETIMTEKTFGDIFADIFVGAQISYPDTSEPTNYLKFVDGVLMQMHIERGSDIGIRRVWKPIPHENTETH